VTDIEMLLAIEAIRQLKARYFRCMDLKDFDGVAATFAADATFGAKSLKTSADGASLADFEVSGRAAIMERITARTRTADIMHHGHMPEIEITGPDSARGIFAMEASHWVIEDDRATAVVRSFGYYHDTFSRRDGRWQTQTSMLVLVRADVERQPGGG
jgi:hypothetical protein